MTAPIERLAKFAAGPETSYEHTVLYRTTTDETPVFDPGEIAEGWFAPLSEIARRVTEDPDDFAPAFRVLLKWYVEHVPA